MNISRDTELQSPQVIALLEEHLEDMFATSPPESVHALDLDKLRLPELHFYTLWDQQALAGCGAFKVLDPQNGEIKSMRTARSHLRQGVAAKVLEHIEQQAKSIGISKLWLETGTPDFFEPARRFYERAGYQYCGPFADYSEDPYSAFMCKQL